MHNMPAQAYLLLHMLNGVAMSTPQHTAQGRQEAGRAALPQPLTGATCAGAPTGARPQQSHVQTRTRALAEPP
jgi:hypothetical protein